MRSIRRSERLPVDIPTLKFRAAVDGDYDELIQQETEIVLGGERVLVYRPMETPHADLIQAFKDTKYGKGGRTEGLISNSRVLGFQPRLTLRRDFCTACSMFNENPAVQEVFFKYAREACAVYREWNPSRYMRATRALERVLPEWRIPGTVFTSGIVNDNNPLMYHHDAGNFKRVWSCMYATANDCAGGYLVLPELRLAFSFAKPALIMFDGQDFIHGVTKIQPRSRRAYRYSVVFYGLEQMKHCKAAAEELARIRTVRVQRERKRAGME